jgi:cellulose synthase (UDP-forming)
MSQSVPSVTLEGPRRLLVGAFAVISLWYLSWRFGTLNPGAPVLSWLVYGAELFGFVGAVLHIFMCWRMSVREAPPVQGTHRVDVFVPTYNEPVALVRHTLLAAMAMKGPRTVWLLDDGRRAEMAALAKHLGCRYLTRPDNAHAKAGNLNHALAHSDGDLIAIFDCDHAPRRDFLTRTLGYFNDPRVAFVQTPQDFYNLDSFQHREGRKGSVWTEQSLFFRVIQRGKDTWNAAFFCGSCAIVRREALEEIGGFATGTVTEDLHTSIRLHARGWKSVYHAQPLAFGVAPESIEPFIGQRVRWGQGAMHVWRKEGLLTHRGLTLAQRLNYFASVLTYFDGWQKGVMYVAPIVVLLTGAMPIVTDTETFLLHFVPYYLLSFWVFEEVGRGYGRMLLIEQYNMARFAAFAWATLAWIVPRGRFKVTVKGGLAGRALRFTAAHWAVAAASVLAIVSGTALHFIDGRLPVEGLVANVLWAGINTALACAVLAFTRRKGRNARADYRFPVPIAAELVAEDGRRLPGTVDDLSIGGLRFYGALPPGIATGQPVTGHLELPEGRLPFWGQVCSVQSSRTGAANDDPRAIGCRFETNAENARRLETFLFGTDLQWHVNGYTDQGHTLLSRLLPAQVSGPSPQPLADERWNAARLTAEDDEELSYAVLAARDDEGTPLIASYAELPTDRDVTLQVHRRTAAPLRRVQLQRLPLDPSAEGIIHAYRALPASDAPALARRAIERARTPRASDSTMDVHPTTI